MLAFLHTCLPACSLLLLVFFFLSVEVFDFSFTDLESRLDRSITNRLKEEVALVRTVAGVSLARFCRVSFVSCVCV